MRRGYNMPSSLEILNDVLNRARDLGIEGGIRSVYRFLFDEGDFYRVIGDNSETLVKKIKVISITKKRNFSSTKKCFSNIKIQKKKSKKEVKKNV